MMRPETAMKHLRMRCREYYGMPSFAAYMDLITRCGMTQKEREAVTVLKAHYAKEIEAARVDE